MEEGPVRSRNTLINLGGGGGRHKQSTVRVGAQAMRRGRKEMEKSDFSFSSFGAATMVFGLIVTQQSSLWGTVMQTILFFGPKL